MSPHQIVWAARHAQTVPPPTLITSLCEKRSLTARNILLNTNALTHHLYRCCNQSKSTQIHCELCLWVTNHKTLGHNQQIKTDTQHFTMDSQMHDALVFYISNRSYPEGCSKDSNNKKVIGWKAASYIVKDQEWYYTGNKQKQPVKVVSEGV